MTRRELLAFALEHRDDYCAATFSGELRAGTAGRLPIQPHAPNCRLLSRGDCTCWQATYAELDRCLASLAELPRRHLRGRYECAWRVRRADVWVRNGHWQVAGNEAVLVPFLDERQRKGRSHRYPDVLLSVWPTWVQARHVEEGLGLVEQAYRGDPWLPTQAVTRAA